jgi:hypothetical protein
MADLSDYSRSALYEHYTGGDPLPQPAGLFVALYLSGSEIADANYERKEVTFGVEDTPGAGVSDAVVEWDPMDDTGSATHFAIFDAASGGNRLSTIKALVPSVEWAPGGIVRIPAGDLAQAWA